MVVQGLVDSSTRYKKTVTALLLRRDPKQRERAAGSRLFLLFACSLKNMFLRYKHVYAAPY